jgi:hypothetical protein
MPSLERRRDGGPGLPFLGSLLLLLLGGASPARAQAYIGPSKCVGCHDHERQATKWQKEEPATLKAKAHFLTLKQLDGPKAAGFAKAIGLADPYDLKGSCVKCHSTVFRGDASAGVSCESCHGPATNYNDLHQVKGSYAKAVAAGMKDLREKPAAIAKVCVDCHITPDKRLAAAGHPTGATFDAGVNLQKIVHWNVVYNYAQVTAAGKTAAAGRAPTGGGPPPGPTASGPPAKGPATKGPGPTSTASEAPTAKGPGATTAPIAPTTPATPAPPWDWDQPIRPLPADYVPEEAPPAPAPDASTPPAATRTARRRPVPPSIAEDSPLPTPPSTTPEAGPVSAAVTPTAVPAGPPSAAAQAAGLRGEGVAALEKLLRAGARSPDLPAPTKPAEYTGPDSELLRLQDEVLALALEALRRPKP